MTSTSKPEEQNAELLPCPFCGGTDIRGVSWNNEDGAVDTFMCDCGGCGPTCEFTADAIAAWNRRYSMPSEERD